MDLIKIKEACARYEGSMLEYNISKSGVMVLCKACDKYLKLLKDDNHHGQDGYDVVMMKVDVKEVVIFVMKEVPKCLIKNKYTIFLISS